MRVLRTLRVLIRLLIATVLVAAVVIVLTTQPDLRRDKRAVDRKWDALRPQLVERYTVLKSTSAELAKVTGPVSQLVSSDVEPALARWQAVVGNASTATQVQAANDVESAAARLVAAAKDSPRVKGDRDAQAAVDAFAENTSYQGGLEFVAAVTKYEQTRRGPLRSVVAGILGYDDIPFYAGPEAG
jgi:hypothetical protein